MIYITHYNSPIGDMLLACKENKLIGAWIEGQKYYFGNLKEKVHESKDEEIFIKTKHWLDRYFNKQKPDINELELAPIGSDFRQRVWKILCKVPYGKVTTYNNIAKQIANEMGIKSMSAQAVGGAIAHNPILVIMPCHRVVGTNGNLTGYAGGIDRKIFLLKLEQVNMENLFV